MYIILYYAWFKGKNNNCKINCKSIELVFMHYSFYMLPEKNALQIHFRHYQLAFYFLFKKYILYFYIWSIKYMEIQKIQKTFLIGYGQ